MISPAEARHENGDWLRADGQLTRRRRLMMPHHRRGLAAEEISVIAA